MLSFSQTQEPVSIFSGEGLKPEVCDSFGVGWRAERLPGGIAALNPRLLSGKPLACFRRPGLGLRPKARMGLLRKSGLRFPPKAGLGLLPKDRIGPGVLDNWVLALTPC